MNENVLFYIMLENVFFFDVFVFGVVNFFVMLFVYGIYFFYNIFFVWYEFVYGVGNEMWV